MVLKRVGYSVSGRFSFHQGLEFLHIVLACDSPGVIQRVDTRKEFDYLFYVFPKREKNVVASH